MDKSELFIKQCDCPEVQGQWKPAWGDWFYDPEYDLAEDNIAVLEKSHEMIDWMEEEIKFEHPSRWLPMQHQIQVMMGFKYAGPGYVRKLWDFTLDESETRAYDSFEQLWLSFYMYEKHKKRWSSSEEKWVKENA